MENYGKTQKQNEDKNEKQTILINPTLKELTEFLSDLFPVLGSIFLTIVLLVQYWYSKTAESFYGIDKSLFYSKNLVYFVTINIITLGLFVTLFLLYCNFNIAQKKDLEAKIFIFIFNFGSMIVPILILNLVLKFPSLGFFIFLLFISFVISILDIVFSDKSKHNNIRIIIIAVIIKLLIIAAYLFSFYQYITVISKSEIEFKKDYEIAFPVDSNNTDWYYGSKNNDSQIFDIVILHKDSQVLLMKGKIEKAQLTLYKGLYSFQDIDKYTYVEKNFTDVSSKVVSLTEESPSEATQPEASPSELSK